MTCEDDPIDTSRVEEWRGGFRSTMRVAGPFGCQCQSIRPCLRFHSPLREPDGRISRIRLSDQRLRAVRPQRDATNRTTQVEQPVLLVELHVGVALNAPPAACACVATTGGAFDTRAVA